MLNYYGDEKDRVNFLNGLGFLKIKDLKSFFHYVIHITDKRFYRRVFNYNPNIDWFNENGDVIGHYKLPNKPIPTDSPSKNVDKSDLDKLKFFIESNLNGVVYYITPPATYELMFNMHEENELNQNF